MLAGSLGCGGGPRPKLLLREGGGGGSLKVGGGRGGRVVRGAAVEERMDNTGGSAAKGLKVEEKIGWGVLTLSSGGKMFLTVEGATLCVLKSSPGRSGLTEFPKS